MARRRMQRGARARRWRALALAGGLAAGPLLGTGCSRATRATSPSGVIDAVGAENQYADVVSQIGGRYVSVSSILNNPSTDPHTFESSPSVAREVSSAELVVQNGAGYDDFMTRIESASPSSKRKLIVVQRLLGLPDDPPNPHIWYSPQTMPRLSRAVADDLSSLQPRHAAYFQANAERFALSLGRLSSAIAAFRAHYGGTAVATTEPVADDLLDAMGADNLTPFRFQADVMNGVDPSPQDILLEKGFFTHHQVKVFCYNAQVTSSLTVTIRNDAKAAGVPVVGVYETMPTPGYDYQSWMLAEVHAIEAAVSSGKSTERL